MDRLLALADPQGMGVVSYDALRSLPCWRTEEEEAREQERVRTAAVLSEQLSPSSAPLSGTLLPGASNAAPATLAPAAVPPPHHAPGPGEHQLVTYVTVPGGSRPGDVLTVAASGKMINAVVPPALRPGDIFGVVNADARSVGPAVVADLPLRTTPTP